MYPNRIACQIRCQLNLLSSVQRGNALLTSNVSNTQSHSSCRKLLDRERTAIVNNKRLISTACKRTASHPLSDGNDFTDSDGPLAKYVQRVEQEIIKVRPMIRSKGMEDGDLERPICLLYEMRLLRFCTPGVQGVACRPTVCFNLSKPLDHH